MTDYVKMGSYLKELRINHGYTQNEAGDAAGISNKQVHNIEYGISPETKLETIKNLCVVYGITLGGLDQFYVMDETMKDDLDYLHKKAADRKIKKTKKSRRI